MLSILKSGPVSDLNKLCPVPPGPAKPLHETFQDGFDEVRSSRARAGERMLHVPPDQRLERHKGSRMVQAPLRTRWRGSH